MRNMHTDPLRIEILPPAILEMDAKERKKVMDRVMYHLKKSKILIVNSNPIPSKFDIFPIGKIFPIRTVFIN